MPSPASNLRYAKKAARRRGINPRIFRAQINQESGGRDVSSPAGAQGPAQLMPATARSLGVNPHKDRQAIDAAAGLMANYLHQYHGDARKALAAYNAGPGAVAAHGGVPPFAETQHYVKSILGAAGTSNGGGGGGGGGGPVSLSPDKLQVGTKTSFDQAGFDKARKGAILGKLIAGNRGTDSPLFKSGLLTTSAPSRADFTTSSLTSKIVKGQGVVGGGGGGNVSGGNAGAMIARAEKVDRAHPSYLWGGGHGPTPAKLGAQVDCSGFVSQVLGVSPRTSGAFMSFGQPGRGKQVTIYANSGHVLMQVGNRWFATSHSNPGGGAGEIARPSKAYLSRFTARHPKGM